MSTAAKFSNNVEISGNVDISGNINLDGTLTVDGSFSLYGYHIPDPSGENNKVLTISGDGYSWETVQSGSDGDEEINPIGQTFYEIITEQPRAFTAEAMTNGTLFNNTFNTIDISWNFDQLIPFDTDNQHLNITGDLNQRVLPCITHIYFDISSDASGEENTTISDSSIFVIAVDANDNYNVDAPSTTPQTWSIGDASLNSTLTYKTLTLSNANTNALLYKYTVRIWGENQSNGTEVNKLTYSDLEFLSSGIPATPTIHSITPSGNATATLDISLNVPDIDNVNLNTEYDAAGGIEIKDVDISGTEIETLRSTTYDHGNSFELSNAVTSQSQPDTNVEDISVNVSYSSTYFNLGSKYEIQAKCINALNATDGSNNDGYTSYSTVFQMTDFIDIPLKESLQTSSPFDSTFTYNDKTKIGSNGAFEINNSGSSSSDIMIYDYSRSVTQSVAFNTTSNPSQIEVSDPDADKNDSFGYGKYIDDSLNLVTLECWLNDNGTDISLHTIHFHGWNNQDVSHTYYYQDSVGNNIDFFTIAGSPYSDVFSGTTRQEGFRLEVGVSSATILLEYMSYNNLMVPFDPYRDEYGNSTGYIRNSNSNADTSYNNGYTFNYRYTHNNCHSTDYSQQIESDQLYIDYFPNYYLTNSGNSSVSNWNYTVEVKTVKYVMGIPSVNEFDLSINRDHYNIHSQYRYHRDDGKIAILRYLHANESDDTPIGSSFQSGNNYYLELPTNIDDFSDDGSYNGGISWTNLNYASQTKAAATDNTITGFQTSTIMYNLHTNTGWFTSDITFTDNGNKNHYFDYDSISDYSTIFTSNSTNRIYELSSSHIGDLDTALNTVNSNLAEYSNHQTEIQSYTLPFINGKFTATTSNYPDICGLFEWDGKISGYSNSVYDSSHVGIDLDGNTGNYKCVVYEVDTQNGNIYYFDSSAKVEGINVSYVINLLFDTTIVNTFNSAISSQGLTFDDDNDIYVFLTTYNSDAAVSRYQLGNLSIPFQSGANWFARAESALSSGAGENGLNTIIKSVTLASGMYVHNNGTKTVAVATDAGWGVTNGSSDDTIIPLTGTGTLSDFKLYFFVKIS